MPRHVLTIKDLGENACWLLVQQAIGTPDAKARTDFMTERVAVLILPSNPVRAPLRDGGRTPDGRLYSV